VKLAGHLKQASEFLLGLDAAAVAPGLDPDHTLTVEVWFVQTLGNRKDYDYPPAGYLNVFRCRGNRAAHVLGCGIGDELIDPAHISATQTLHVAIIGAARAPEMVDFDV